MTRNGEELQDKKLIKIIIGLGIIGGVTPFILEWVVFRSNIYSAIDNGDWASFLGSFLGGIVGGIGTLIAVYFTTNQTRKIQEKNEEKLNDEIKLRQRKERKEFADEIAILVSKYIADVKRHNKNLGHASDVDKEIEELQAKLKHFIHNNYNNNFNDNISSVENQISRKMKEKNNIELDRITADECYNLLMIKLSNMDKANDIIKWLNNNDFILWNESSLNSLRYIANNFIKEYIENDN